MDDRHASIVIGFRCHKDGLGEVLWNGHQAQAPDPIRGSTGILHIDASFSVWFRFERPCPFVELGNLLLSFAQQNPNQGVYGNIVPVVIAYCWKVNAFGVFVSYISITGKVNGHVAIIFVF